MQCLNPVLAFTKDYINKNGITCNKPVEFYNFKDFCRSNDIRLFDKYGHSKGELNNQSIKILLNRDDVMLLPCRHCINCQLDRSREWAIRNSFESRYFEDKFFLTLTYNNQGIEHCYNSVGLASLKMSDVQCFLKRLRKRTGQKFRYYLAGEYGTNTFRPHYHILMYGLKLNDLNYLYSRNNNKYYTSDTISKSWDYGFHIISDFSDYTAMYTARYCTKKIGDTRYMYKKNNMLPEFNTMSRRGGIGINYIKENKDSIYANDKFLFHINEKTFELKPLAFFDRYYNVENPFHMKFIKENRKEFAKEHNFFAELETDLSYVEYLEMLERNAKELIKFKKRSNFNESTQT